MLIQSQHLYRITYTTHTYIQYTITSQLQHTSHNLQSCKAGHTLPFFPILAKTSISSILHGTDGRQLKSSLVYIYLYWNYTALCILELQSRLPRRKASYSLPKNCTSNRAQLPRLNFYSSLLHTKTCIIMYFLHSAFVFNMSSRMAFFHVFFSERNSFLYIELQDFFLMIFFLNFVGYIKGVIYWRQRKWSTTAM